MAFYLKVVGAAIVFAFVAVYLVDLWIDSKSYTFDHDAIATIAKKHAGKSHEVAYKEVESELRKRYGARIIPNPRWVFVNAGGWMGAMYVLHASLSEYLLFFGTAVPTSGHSGRYLLNISDTVIQGKYLQWPEGDTKTNTYLPGDVIFHASGEAAAIQWDGDTWMVEYGRGFIPSSLCFALADTVFSTTDWSILWNTVKVYTGAMFHELTLALWA